MTESEILIADFLKNISIYWTFEQPVYISDDCDRPRIFAPDFYLPELGMYLEVVGNPHNPDYHRRKEIYLKNNIPIIFVTPFHNKDWKNDLKDAIVRIHQERWEKIQKFQNWWW